MTDTLILPKNPTLKDFKHYVKNLCDERNFNQTDPILEMLFLTEEIGELARVIRRVDPRGHIDKDKAEKYNVSGELADCFTYLLNISNIYGVDLEKAFRDKEEVNKKRVWKKN